MFTNSRFRIKMRDPGRGPLGSSMGRGGEFLIAGKRKGGPGAVWGG
nr:MAG TPA: hypothetical protein [Caudoviricetes sp.]